MIRLSLTAAVAALALSACGGGSTGTAPVPGMPFCDPGTQVQLARPLNGQSGVSTATNSIEIVANGNNNTLGQSFQNFNLILVPQFGFGQIGSAGLSAVADPNGPHPFTSDFFYQGTLSSGLAPGQFYSVFLNANTNCQPVQVGGFST